MPNINTTEAASLWVRIEKDWNLKHQFSETERNTLKEQLDLENITEEKYTAAIHHNKTAKAALADLMINQANAALTANSEDAAIKEQLLAFLKIARERKADALKTAAPARGPAPKKTFPDVLKYQADFSYEQHLYQATFSSLGIISGITPALAIVGGIADTYREGVPLSNAVTYAQARLQTSMHYLLGTAGAEQGVEHDDDGGVANTIRTVRTPR